MGAKKGKKSDVEKGLVLARLGGDLKPIVVTSLDAGGDKGETGQHLPLSLVGGLVVVICFCVASVSLL